MGSGRLLPARVANAFRDTGLTPARLVLLEGDGRACGLAAAVADMTTDRRFVSAKEPTRYMAKILHLDAAYAVGWADGWDKGCPAGWTPPVPWDRCPEFGWGRRQWGWHDGAAAAVAVIGAAQ